LTTLLRIERNKIYSSNLVITAAPGSQTATCFLTNTLYRVIRCTKLKIDDFCSFGAAVGLSSCSSYSSRRTILHEAISALSVSTESVRCNLYQRIGLWLLEHDADQLPEVKFKYAEPPWFSSQEAHSFEWSGSHRGWIDVLRNDKSVVQVVLNLSYPKKSWFCKHKRDWHHMNDEAEFLFGQGQNFKFPNKLGVLYEVEDIKFLLSSYDEGRQAYIEIKAARDRFCS
jgi:hypothetical protein